MAGAGALANSGVHPIDLLRFLVGSEIEEVRALTDEKPPEYPVDDMVYTILKFQNGMHGVVISGILVPRSDNDVVLYGSKAKITCKGTVGVRLEGEFLLESDCLDTRMVFSVDDPISALYTPVIEAFNKCIEENTEPEISGYDGLEMVRIMNAILESSRQGRAIKITR
jgi:predicted dehydrogenase